VFNPPAPYLFAALAKPTAQERWQEVSSLVDERRAKYPDVTVTRVSQQAVGIIDKVADANAYLRDNPDAQSWLLECHPEISFLRLNGGSRLAPKSSATGALNRLELSEREFPSVREGLREHPLGRTIPLADLLDAYAALWTALRIASGIVDPNRDALGVGPDGHYPQADGVAMRIVA
jgi:predicted RNase H-like nuclease